MKHVAVLLACLALACDSPFQFAAPIAIVRIIPDSAALLPGDSVLLSVVATDSVGTVIRGVHVDWSTASALVATVSPAGLVHALGPGRAVITAAVQGVQGLASLTVVTDIVAARIDQGDVTLVPGGVLQFSASGRDAAGDTLHGRPVTWWTGDSSVVRVSDSGLATGLRPGDTFLAATFGGVQQSVPVSVRPVRFYAVVAASPADHTCALASPGMTFCWGTNNLGQLGVPAIPGSPAPVAATRNPAFNDVTVGGTFSCGNLAVGGIYCWGSSARGRLGAGSQQQSTAVPVPLSISLDYFAAGWAHACGLAGGRTTCWGENPAAGSTGGTISWTPLGVASDSSFVVITAGSGFTCALTQSGLPFCWGVNDVGQLGIGGTQNTSTPSPLAGLALTAITAGFAHACGIDAGGEAFCWGANGRGQLGTGDTTSSTSPLPVSGGLLFAQIAAGGNRTCAVTAAAGQVYCWGDGSPTPTLLGGGLSFITISLGNEHACGFTSDGVYCWGKNNAGQLGDGTLIDRATPTRVLGQP